MTLVLEQNFMLHDNAQFYNGQRRADRRHQGQRRQRLVCRATFWNRSHL